MATLFTSSLFKSNRFSAVDGDAGLDCLGLGDGLTVVVDLNELGFRLTVLVDLLVLGFRLTVLGVSRSLTALL